MDLNKNNIKKILGIITFTVILCALLLNLGVVLKGIKFLWVICFPFVLGGAFAFIINMPMSFFESKLLKIAKKGKLTRPASVIFTLLIAVAVIYILIMVVAPQLGNTFKNIGMEMAASLPQIQDWLAEKFSGSDEIVNFITNMELDWGGWLDTIKNFALNGAGNVLSYTMSATKLVVNGVVTFTIAFIFSIYILMQKENLQRQLIKLMRAILKEKAVEKMYATCHLSHITFTRFITGQCMEALILGGMFFVAMTIFRLPYALLVGMLIAFTALIPIVGAFIGCAIGAFLIVMVDPMQAVGFVILFLVLQQIEGNLIYPYVVGNSVGLPSIWVLVAVTVGGGLMGIPGMLVFIPIVSVLYSLLRDWVNARILKKEGKQSS